MLSKQAALRATSRAGRVRTPAIKRHARFASDAKPNSSSGLSHAAIGGLAGSGAAGLLGYIWYRASGLGQTVDTTKQMKSYVDSTLDQLKVEFKEKTPEPDEMLGMLKQTAEKYASFVPGGKDYVNKVFKDLELVRNKHGAEVDAIVKDAYGDLRDASKQGMNLETVSNVWNILSKHLQRLGSLAADAGQDILQNHPGLKDKLGGSFDQLKQFGDNLGPEAKKQVDETWKEISGIVQQGVQWDTVDRIRKLVQEKVQSLKELSNQAWEKGMEQVKPMLEKNPQLKQLVEQNKEVLSNGNITEALDKVKQAVNTGDGGELEQYIKSAKQKVDKASSGSLDSWLEMVPNGSKILPQLQKLKQVAESEGEQAKELAHDTMKDIMQVLEKRGDQIEKLFKEAQNEAKK